MPPSQTGEPDKKPLLDRHEERAANWRFYVTVIAGFFAQVVPRYNAYRSDNFRASSGHPFGTLGPEMAVAGHRGFTASAGSLVLLQR